MSIDCHLLAARVKGGSSVCIQECGGIQMKSGDVLIVKEPLAGALYTRYKPLLSAPISVQLEDQTRLRHGHYEFRRLGLVLNVKDTEPVETEKVLVEDLQETETTIIDVANNRSMTNTRVKRKRRIKGGEDA